jgi:hypothetical protein
MKALAQVMLVGVLALGACESPGEPKDPIWGKQACGACSMLVSEPAHAAQLVTKEETRVYFDDVGCMAAYMIERNLNPPKMWVRDSAGKWVDARSAKFKSGAKTPMDFGYSYAADGDATFVDVQLAAKKRAERR